jgi:hypothetical protein
VATPHPDTAGPKERQSRQRPALTSMLDRLNKPLIAPKEEEYD